MKAGNINELNREQRAIARLARIARNNTIFGGASALVIAKRMESIGSTIPALEIVSDVYSRSTGRDSEQYGCWECPECGMSHLGQDSAISCCSIEND